MPYPLPAMPYPLEGPFWGAACAPGYGEATVVRVAGVASATVVLSGAGAEGGGGESGCGPPRPDQLSVGDPARPNATSSGGEEAGRPRGAVAGAGGGPSGEEALCPFCGEKCSIESGPENADIADTGRSVGGGGEAAAICRNTRLCGATELMPHSSG